MMSDLDGGAPVNGYRVSTREQIRGHAGASGRRRSCRWQGPPGARRSSSLDHGLVREIRRQVAERLAARLQATPDLPSTRGESSVGPWWRRYWRSAPASVPEPENRSRLPPRSTRWRRR